MVYSILVYLLRRLHDNDAFHATLTVTRHTAVEGISAGLSRNELNHGRLPSLGRDVDLRRNCRSQHDWRTVAMLRALANFNARCRYRVDRKVMQSGASSVVKPYADRFPDFDRQGGWFEAKLVARLDDQALA